MTSADELFRSGLASLQAGKVDAAENALTKLVAAQPRHIAGLNILGVLLSNLGRYAEAEQYVRRALREQVSEATLHNYGVILKALKRPDEALAAFDRALSINPNSPDTWNNRGATLNDLVRHSEALEAFDRALAIAPGYVAARFNKAKTLAKSKAYAEAMTEYDRTIATNPTMAEAWLGRANIKAKLGRHHDAFRDYERALALNDRLGQAWMGLGVASLEAGQFERAQQALERAFALRQASDEIDEGFIFVKLQLCDWSNLAAETARLIDEARDRSALSPEITLVLPFSAEEQFAWARQYVSGQPKHPSLWSGDLYDHEKIRVAYVSGDFREHATAWLTAGLFEHHDRGRFEVVGLSFGIDDQSAMRRRLEHAFDRFHDVQHMGDHEIAMLIREMGIDIAVDLKGLTQDARPGVFARRPAPVQVNYLGYPGTMGTGAMDYIIGDRTTIPNDHRQFYAEKVVWLPDSYQVNDSKREIAASGPSRSQCGLPDGAFVFACFNNSYKLTPTTFDIWMRLINAVEGSVLWLLEANPMAAANLRREAQTRGVDPERLVFAPRIPMREHLARHRHADLFLDTLPYNAHTTASDALWSGTPVLTCLGSTFAGRVAGSLLQAAGLSELVTTSLADYEALALKIARDPAMLASLKSRIAQNRENCRLFDTPGFARSIEAAYTVMWQRQRQGEQPSHIAL